MQTVRAVATTPVADSGRVQQIGGMFDLGVPERVETTFEAEIPDLQDDWRIGAIVGPSGSGKSTIARKAFGRQLYTRRPWPKAVAIVDCFGKRTTREITNMLTAVGFSSPPAWIRPYRTLSNGEQFRADLARALLTGGELVAYDEFTSVVDRTVAQVGSAAVAKSIRKGIVAGRFVAITCHYDILPWLEPDWVLDTSDWSLTRRRLRRPKLTLEIRRCLSDAWTLFKRHHYLSANLHRSARCFLGVCRDRPIAFAAVLPSPGKVGSRRISRVVVLPDWQGIGVGRAMCGAIGELYRREGLTLTLLTSHAMMIGALDRDPRWTISGVYRTGCPRAGGELYWHLTSKRPGVSFRYVGETGEKTTEKRRRRRAGGR